MAISNVTNNRSDRASVETSRGFTASAKPPISGSTQGTSPAPESEVVTTPAPRLIGQDQGRSVDVEQKVSQLNEIVSQSQRELRFSVDDSTGEMIIQVLDSATDEVIRQIPPDEVTNLLHLLQRGHSGTLVSVEA